MTEAPIWRRRDPFAGQTVAFSARYKADVRENRAGHRWSVEGVALEGLRGTVVRVINGWMCIVKWSGHPHETIYHRDHIVAVFDIAHDAAEWDRRTGGRA
jgi:hypothetical protein